MASVCKKKHSKVFSKKNKIDLGNHKVNSRSR